MARDGGLQAADRTLASAVADTLENLDLSAEDAALSRLVRSYAEQIDRAAAAEASAGRVLRRVEDPELADEIQALKTRLSARTAVENLGPKLVAALESLGASPKARASLGKGGASGGSGRLAALRGQSA